MIRTICVYTNKQGIKQHFSCLQQFYIKTMLNELNVFDDDITSKTYNK